MKALAQVSHVSGTEGYVKVPIHVSQKPLQALKQFDSDRCFPVFHKDRKAIVSQAAWLTLLPQAPPILK